MCFDQPTGVPHAVRWLKSFVSTSKQVFLYFSVINGKKEEKRKESTKITQKNMHKKGVYQGITVTLKPWLTPNSGSTPGENLIFLFRLKSVILFQFYVCFCAAFLSFIFFPFVTEKYEKLV